MGSVDIRSENAALARQLFNDMWASVSVNPDGSIPYPDFFNIDGYLPLLANMISATSPVTTNEKINIIRAAFLAQRNDPKKDFDRFIAEIDDKVRSILILPETTFYLSTKISFRKDNIVNNISKTLENSKITLCAQLPKRLRTDAWEMNGFGRVTPSEPQGYASLFATTTSRTASQAAKSMLGDVKLLTACLNLAYSSARIIFRTGKNRPLSRIRLGAFQLIHDHSGAADKDRIWYEDEYDVVENPQSLLEDLPQIRRFIDAFFFKLKATRLGDVLEAGIRQYNAALNTREPQLCLIRLWSALEILMQSTAGGSKVTACRAAFFSQQHDYRLRKLHYIAGVRNGYVHSGSEITLVDELVGDLRSYVSTIIRIMVFSEICGLTNNQLSSLLDMPAALPAIKERLMLDRLGLKVRK